MFSMFSRISGVTDQQPSFFRRDLNHDKLLKSLSGRKRKIIFKGLSNVFGYKTLFL